MTKALPDPPVDCLAVNEHLSFEDAQLYIAHLIHSASATVLDCGDHLPPTTAPRSTPCGTCWKWPRPWSTAPSTACPARPDSQRRSNVGDRGVP